MEESDYLLKIILKHAGVLKDYLRTFKQNELVNEDVLAEITAENLQEIGLTNRTHIEKILATRDRILGSQLAPDSSQSQSDLASPAGQKSITKNMLLASVPSKKKKKFEEESDFLAGITHVSLSEKRIGLIDNLFLCPNIQILNLYDNNISQMQCFESLTNLKLLYLQGNQIAKIEGLESNSSLQRLNLSRNFISRLEGLQACGRLEELDLGYQQVDVPFLLEEQSIITISRPLRKLKLNSCNLLEIAHLQFCDSVDELDLSDNQIDFAEDVFRSLTCMEFLTNLNMKNNPITRRKKYRDEIISMNGHIQELDGKNVTTNEREYIYRLGARKQQNFQNKSAREAKAAAAAQPPPQPVQQPPTQYKMAIPLSANANAPSGPTSVQREKLNSADSLHIARFEENKYESKFYK